MKEKKKITLHRPYGSENPYHQGPDERFPRKPVAGQPVHLGVTVPLVENISSVWAEVRINGDADAQTISGQKLEISEAVDIWQIKLPAFQGNDHVSYVIYASDGQNTIQAEEYDFTCLAWKANANHVTYSLNPEGIDIHFPETDALPQTDFRLIFCNNGRIDLQFSLGKNPNQYQNLEKQYQVLNQSDKSIQISNDLVRIELSTYPYHLEIFNRKGSRILSHDTPPLWLVNGENETEAVQLSFLNDSMEGFYGFGERFNGLNQRGNKLDIRVYEEYKNQKLRTYFPVPFFLSSMGYGFYVDTSREVVFDLGLDGKQQWICETALNGDQTASFQLFVNSKPLDNLRAFVNQIGRPKLPPDWIFGLWMSSNEWNSQAEVMKQIQLTQDHGIGAKVLVIEAWSDEATFYIWNDAKYTPKTGSGEFAYDDFDFPDDGLWPDPKAMIERIHELGMKVILWQIPVLKKMNESHPQRDADEAYMIEQGYCVMNPDGTPHRIHTPWFPGSLLLDVTNPEAVDWWLSKRAYLVDELKIDGFKTDGGEHLWPRDARFANGKTGHEEINPYPNKYVGAYHRFANEKRGGDAVTFSRAGFTGAQAFPCHWAGDENSNWQAYRSNLMAGLNVGLSGVPFWAWDIAGFSGPIPTAELYLRSTAMAAFCPIMQYHSEFNNHQKPNVDRTPWNIADRTGRPEVIDIFRKFVTVRETMLPYILEEAKHCAQTGDPLMRPLFLDWPEDPLAWRIEDQYCFGRSLLVAPILEEGCVERRVYLPFGTWEDFWTKEVHDGRQWITREAPLDEIPVYKLIS